MDTSQGTSGKNFLSLPTPRGPTFKVRPKPTRPRSITSPPRSSRPRSLTSPPRTRPPKPPIKTYQWEEVRRAKAKGGYPWTYLQLWQATKDHEYETVMAPPPTVRVTGPNYDRYEPELGNAPRREGSNSSDENRERERKERKFLRIPLEDEMVGLPADGEGSEDEAMGVEEKEDTHLDDRAIAAPSPGTTTGSRTDLELNTSQVDSSALEDLPLSRSARRQQRLEQQAEDRGPGAATRSLQRIRLQAGKLRTKLRSIKRPNITMPDRPRFQMPERPKFNLPERPKFSLPERPKFNLPSRPKFNIERPKFNLPERPKFNFPSFSLPRNRRPFRERQESSSVEETGEHVDTPAIISTPGKRNYFDFRTYPRIFDRKSRQSAPTRSRPRPITPPAMRYEDDNEDDMDIDDDEPIRKPKLPPRRRSSNGQQQQHQRWVGKFTELEYADAENFGPIPKTNGTSAPFDDEDDDEEIRALERELHAADTEEEQSESLSGFRDKDFGYAVSLGPVRAAPPPMMDPDDEEVSLQESEREVAHSSGSSSDRRRAGVLEEIDSDEFFLREKGLSQEDVDVGRYLSSEIREAFRPVPHETKNAILIQNATMNEEAELARSYRGTPERATKTRPPRRVRSAKQTQQRISPPPPPVPVEPDQEKPIDTQHYFNTFPPNKLTRNRRRQLRQEREKKVYATATVGRPAFPTAPRRKKRTRSEFGLGDNTSQWSEDLNPEWIKTVESQVVTNEVGVGVMMAIMRSDPVEHDYIIPGAPAAPKRGRRIVRPTTTQPEDEDDHSHVSEPPEPGYASVIKPGIVEIEIVDKHPQQEVHPPCTPPPRRTKVPPRPPFPSIRRRRNRPLSGSGAPHFFTVPHRRGPPTRPMRNYSTLGPSRPPRRQRRASLEDLHDGNRNLHSGAVIKKMKERPLPPPPRPPRRDRAADEGDSGVPAEEENNQILATESQANSEVLDNVICDDVEAENVVQHTFQLSASSELIHTQHKIPSEKGSKPGSPQFQFTETQITISPPPPMEEYEMEPEITSEVQVEAMSENIEKVASTEIPQIVTSTEIPEVIEISPVENIKDSETPLVEIIQVSEMEFVNESIKPLSCEQHPENESKIDTETVVESCEMSTQSAPEDCFLTVEEVSVSTQTDPLPEEELLRLEMEQEEAMCSVPCEPVPVTVSAPPQPEMPPATLAILQALNAGQLRLELLDVARLNVNELQAQRLLVSDIDGLSLNVNELQSQGGALVLSTIDAPMGSLAQALVAAAQQLAPPPPEPIKPEPVPSTSTATQCDPPEPEILTPEVIPIAVPEVTPIFIPEVTPISIPEITPISIPEETPVSVPQIVPVSEPVVIPAIQRLQQEVPILVEPQESVQAPIATTSSTHEPHNSETATTSVIPQAAPALVQEPAVLRHSQSPVFTTEQVVALQAAAMNSAVGRIELSSPPRRPSVPEVWQPALQHQPARYQEETGIMELGSRLIRACYSATIGALGRVVTYSEHQIASENTQERGRIQVALCIVLALVAGIILIGLGGSGAEVHHHHWDFYMPK